VKRREFAVLLGAAAMAWPVSAIAQSDKVAQIGILVLGNPDPTPFLKEFKDALRELGYVEGRNVRFEFRSAERKIANLAPLAADLVARKVDVLVTYQTPAATAAKQATKDIPIVMGTVGDPVGTGLVASLARPGGNITGVSGATAELGAKNLELVREVFPSSRRVAVLANAPDPFHKPFLEHIANAAKAMNFEIKTVLARNADELDAHFGEIAQWRADGVVVQPSLPHKRVADLAIKHKLAAFAPNPEFSAAGGLMSYSADLEALFRKGATFVDNILKGRKPADLPVQQPTKFLLVVNLKTAKAIGVTVPGLMLTRADQVIE
jgi:putative tryptophan/tyrosine transport system substrate-binding protein